MKQKYYIIWFLIFLLILIFCENYLILPLNLTVNGLKTMTKRCKVNATIMYADKKRNIFLK
jgi:hypothetical protein